jgi:hypothetical protein
MIAYKYRSLQNFENVVDIFCYNRFYAAQYFELNDPMEGIYQCDKGTKQEYLDEIKKGKQKLRICSFSREYNNLVLWAHYADGFKGICIKAKIEECPNHQLVKVDYDDFKPIFNNDCADWVHSWPQYILKEKNKVWKYEKEVRILTQKEFVSGPITILSVYFGLRTPATLKKALLRIIPSNIKLYDTKISSKTNKVILGQPLRSSESQ